jgi:hypothetical protein
MKQLSLICCFLFATFLASAHTQNGLPAQVANVGTGTGTFAGDPTLANFADKTATNSKA